MDARHATGQRSRFQTVIMLAMFSWWFVLQLFTLAALPLAWRCSRRLPGRGYPHGEGVGAVAGWRTCCPDWRAHCICFANDVGGIWFRAAGCGGSSWWLGRDGLRRSAGAGGRDTGVGPPLRPLVAWLADHWPVWATSEVLFLVVLVVGLRFEPTGLIRRHREADGVCFVNGVFTAASSRPRIPGFPVMRSAITTSAT